MKRGMSGKTRRGAPPLLQQRLALRVVQATFLGLAAFFGWLAFRAYAVYRSAPEAAELGRRVEGGIGEVMALAIGALVFLGLTIAMGIRAVRGPEPPEL